MRVRERERGSKRVRQRTEKVRERRLIAAIDQQRGARGESSFILHI